MAGDSFSTLDPKDTIKSLKRFMDNPAQAPLPLLEHCVKFINKKYKALALAHVGGEGIVLKCLDELNHKLCIKIALENITEQNVQRNVNIFNLIRYQKDNEVINTGVERFTKGCELQRNLYKEIIKNLFNNDPNRTSFFYIPEVYQVTSVPFLHCIMEWVESPNILTILKNHKDGILFSLNMFIKLLGACRFLHERGILHRDLKSENLLIGEKEEIVIIDWTLSKEFGDRNLTIMNTQAGTLGFAPLKFIQDKDFKNANYLDDIYMLGFTFYEFLTCQTLPLLEAKDYTYKKIEQFRVYLAEKLPEMFKVIFWKATHQNEEERYQTVEEFQNAVIEMRNQYVGSKNMFSNITDIKLPEVLSMAEETPEVIFDTKLDLTEEDFNNIINTKCINCGKCKDAFPCKNIRIEVIEIIKELKKRNYL